VNVYATEARNRQHPRREYFSVSRHHARVRQNGFKNLSHFYICFDLCRLMDRYAPLDRQGFYGRGVDLLAASSRLVWLSEYCGNLVAGKYQPLVRWQLKLRSAT